MIIIAWNCRGLVRPLAVQSLRALVTPSSPDCLVISEVKISEAQLRRRLRTVRFTNLVYVPPIGLSGGFGVARRYGVELEPWIIEKNIISCLVYFDPPHKPWTLTAIYGPPSTRDRKSFWSLPVKLQRCPEAMVLIGDFNGTISDEEFWRNGTGIGGSSSSSRALRECCNLLGLVDLGAQGSQFTWSQRIGGLLITRSRLDRAVASLEFSGMFPQASVRVLPDFSSDHQPTKLDTMGEKFGSFKPFKFEAMWARDVCSHWVVKRA